ncbi:hypothetical protein PIROE2DRAFT_67610 [Piromyces sp. E2]|nr:hypothetical protein PIROE2DRAFT_67610 [Piromyces sp. E2]|eukprot:OUM60436.1 hypothetical protein PIROE2DRAFT_67610 [Piromyces sp. E2]
MKRKTDGYKDRLTEEMQWDLGITRLYTALNSQYQFTMDDFNYGIESANYEGSKFFFGILDWTTLICDTVCKQFNIQYDKTAYTPETAAAVQQDTKPIDPGSKYDPEANLNTNANAESGSEMNLANIALAILAVAISLTIFFL